MEKALQKPLQPLDELEAARSIAIIAHKNQVRKRSGVPYIKHPEAVASGLEDNDLKIIAWLHDVIEDNEGWSAERLLQHGISEDNVLSVVTLTKIKGETYLDYILRMIDDDDPDAIAVKIADIEDNLKGLEPGSKRDKYELAKYILEEEL